MLELENEIDLFDQNSFMLSSTLNQNYLGEIDWCSQNAEQLLKRQNNLVMKTQLSNILPQSIQQIHDKLQINYLENGYSKNAHQKIYTFCVDYEKCLFQIMKIIKIYIRQNQIYQIAYIKKTQEQSSILTTQYGMIDCFSEIFFKCTDIEYNFPFQNQSMSIFLFMPSLIVFYLKEFYEIPEFYIESFNYSNFKSTYLFVYKDQEELILKLQKKIQQNNLKGPQEIGTEIYKFLRKLSFKDMQSAFYIDIEFIQNIVERENIQKRFFEIRIKNASKVVQLKEKDFTTQFSFIEKLNFNESLLYSIERYSQRVEEQRINQQERIQQSTLYFSLHYQKSNANQEKNYDQKADLTNKLFVDKNSSNNVSINEDHKERATRIIKKLFEKKFNPGGDSSSWSKAKKKWIDIINKHNSNKNQARGTIIYQHIENIPSLFNEDDFLKKPINILPIEYNIENTINQKKKFQDQQQKSAIEQVDSSQIQVLEKNIERNRWIKRVNFYLIFTFFVANFLLSISLKFYSIKHQDNDLDIFNKDNAEKLLFKSKALSSIIYANSYFSYIQNLQTNKLNSEGLKRNQKLEDSEKEKFDLVLNIYLQTLKEQSKNTHEFQQNKYFDLFFTKTDFNLIYGDKLSLTLDHFIKLLNIKSNYDKINFNKYIKNQRLMFELNYEIIFQKVIEYYTNFQYITNHGFEDQIEDKLIMQTMLLFFYMLVNIICLSILIYYFKYSQNIFYLMMKIEKKQVHYWRGYFKELNFQIKIAQSYEPLYNFVYRPKQKSQKETKMRDFKIVDKKKYFWFFVSILILCFQIPIVIYENKDQQRQIKQLYIQYKYFEKITYYNLFQGIVNWNMLSYMQQDNQINWKKNKQTQDMLQNAEVFFNSFFDYKSIESYFYQGENLSQFYTDYTGNEICEKLQQYKFCDYPEFTYIYNNSFQIQLYENYFLFQKFLTWTKEKEGQQNIKYKNLFAKQIEDNLFKSFGLQVILPEFSKQQINRIETAIENLTKKSLYWFYFDIASILVIFLIIYFIMCKKLRKESVQNSSFIELIPIEVLIRNQYFKISIKKNQYQIIEKYKKLKFIKKRKRNLLNTIKLKINRLKDTKY